MLQPSPAMDDHLRKLTIFATLVMARSCSSRSPARLIRRQARAERNEAEAACTEAAFA
jgi:hypothetical protein